MKTLLRNTVTALALGGLLNAPMTVIAEDNSESLGQRLRTEQLQELEVNVRSSLLSGSREAEVQNSLRQDKVQGRDHDIKSVSEIIRLPQERVSFSPR